DDHASHTPLTHRITASPTNNTTANNSETDMIPLQLNMVPCGPVLGGLAFGKVTPAESVVSEPAATPAASPDETAKSSAGDADITLDAASLLPDLPPVPAGKATLVGGTIERLDRVQDRLTVHVFGGEKMKILFDTRTG